jgi:hypothetical protein
LEPSAIKGLSIQATDGPAGAVTDLMLDDADRGIRRIVVNTGDWLPGLWQVRYLTVHTPYVAADTSDGAVEELFHTYYGIRLARR